MKTCFLNYIAIEIKWQKAYTRNLKITKIPHLYI